MTRTFDSAKTMRKTIEPQPKSLLAKEFDKFFPLEEEDDSDMEEPIVYPHKKDMSLNELYNKFFSSSDTSRTRAMLRDLDKYEEEKIARNKMWADAIADLTAVRTTALDNVGKAFSQKGDPRKTCGLCGGYLSIIRGRYPKSDNRVVCPTCLADRMENINEISGKNFGCNSTNK